MTAPFTILADGSLRLGSGTVIGALRSSPTTAQFIADQISWNAATTATLLAAPTVGNLLVAVIAGCNQPSDPNVTWYAPGDGWTEQGGDGGNTNVRRVLVWGYRPVVDGDTTSIALGSFGDQTGTLGGSGGSYVLYEVSGVDSSDLPGSATAGVMISYDPTSGDPTCGYPTDAIPVPGGGLALCAAAFTSVAPQSAVVGVSASPKPSLLDSALMSSGELVLATYAADAAGITNAVGEINGPVANSGNVSTIELLILFQGPKVNPGSLAVVVAGPGIAVDGTVPSRPVVSNVGLDSRISLQTGDTHVDLPGDFTHWVAIGVDTAPLHYMNGDASRDLAGVDFSLAEDGSGINVLTECTIMVRVAFQMSVLHGTSVAYIAPLYATTHASGFVGLISGDGDPMSLGVGGQDQDLIGMYLWRVAAGSFLQFAVTISGNNATEQTDGFEIDVVRIA